METNLKKGIFSVFSANVINMIFKVLTSLLLPKYLSIDAYAQIKTYELYLNYVGFLHLGYADGMYLRYGGKKIEDLDQREIEPSRVTMIVFQTAVAAAFVIVSLIQKDLILTAFSLTILPWNMMEYYKSFYQAIGRFKDYSRILNVSVAAIFIVNCVLLLSGVTDSGICYIALYTSAYILIWLALNRGYRKVIERKENQIGKPGYFDWKLFGSNIASGFYLMLGNFAFIFMTGMDRWFVKTLMDNSAFAQYSFAVTLEGMVTVAVTPLSTTLYNYFCNHQTDDEIRESARKIIVFSAMILAVVFPISFILDYYLPAYRASEQVLVILIGAQLFTIPVRCVYVNVYKAQKKQSRYFSRLIAVLIFGFLANVLFWFLTRSKEGFAWGTFLSGIFWLLLSLKDYREIPLGRNTYIFLTLSCLLYFLCGLRQTSAATFAGYAAGILILIVWLEKKEFYDMKAYLSRLVSRIREKTDQSS